MLQAVAPVREYTAEDERTDAQRYFDAQMSRDRAVGGTSAMAIAATGNPPPAPAGSWGFDHGQTAAIQVTSRPMQQARPAAQELVLTTNIPHAFANAPTPLMAPPTTARPTAQPVAQTALDQNNVLRQKPWNLSIGGADPHGIIASTGNTVGALDHIAEVAAAMTMETLQHAQQSSLPVGPPRSYAASQGGWSAGHLKAAHAAPVVNAALAQAEHLADVKVVQQAVLMHEGVGSGPPPPTVGSWQLDHGSTARAAAQTGALQPAAPAVPAMGLAASANIPHAFANAVAARINDVVGGWTGDHNGHARVEVAAAKVGGAERAVTSAPLGIWGADHGAVLKSEVKPSQAQLAVAASYSHSHDAEAVEAGFQEHGDKLRR